MPSGTISQPPANPGNSIWKGQDHLKKSRRNRLPGTVWNNAHFLFYRKTLYHIALVKTTKGDIVLIPPGYGHVTINPSAEETLVMANLVSTAFVSPPCFRQFLFDPLNAKTPIQFWSTWRQVPPNSVIERGGTWGEEHDRHTQDGGFVWTLRIALSLRPLTAYHSDLCWSVESLQ